jgi:hypothetical protein
VITPGDPGAADVKMEIRIDRDVHTISPLIYGTNQPQNPTQNKYAVLRSGGNRMTAYNWETNASNAGSDYMFQNDGFISDSNTPGAGVQGLLTSAKAIGATAVLTIPIVDYVAGDKNGGGDVRNSGADYLQTRFKQNRAVKGGALAATPDATDASSATSTTRACDCPPCFARSAAATATALASRSHNSTTAPDSSILRATARPMPPAPPVTIATRPERS